MKSLISFLLSLLFYSLIAPAPLLAQTSKITLSDGGTFNFTLPTKILSASGDNDSYIFKNPWPLLAGESWAGRSAGAQGSFRFTAANNVLAFYGNTAKESGNSWSGFAFLMPGQSLTTAGPITGSFFTAYQVPKSIPGYPPSPNPSYGSSFILPNLSGAVQWAQSMTIGNFSYTTTTITSDAWGEVLVPWNGWSGPLSSLVTFFPSGSLVGPYALPVLPTKFTPQTAIQWSGTISTGLTITQGQAMSELYFRFQPQALAMPGSPWNAATGTAVYGKSTLLVWNSANNNVEMISGPILTNGGLISNGTTGTVLGTYTPPSGWQGDIAFVTCFGQQPNSSDGWSCALISGTGVVSNQVPPTGTITSPSYTRAGSQVPVSFQITSGT